MNKVNCFTINEAKQTIDPGISDLYLDNSNQKV